MPASPAFRAVMKHCWGVLSFSPSLGVSELQGSASRWRRWLCSAALRLDAGYRARGPRRARQRMSEGPAEAAAGCGCTAGVLRLCFRISACFIFCPVFPLDNSNELLRAAFRVSSREMGIPPFPGATMAATLFVRGDALWLHVIPSGYQGTKRPKFI